MGEYHTISKAPCGYETVCKVGTCEDWRYTRREEAVVLRPHDAGAQTDFAWALDETPSKCFFRFPWPSEDWKESMPHGRSEPPYPVCIERIQAREMFDTYTIDLVDELGLKVYADHESGRGLHVRSTPNNRGGRAFGCNIPCPLTAKFRELSLAPSPWVIERHAGGMVKRSMYELNIIAERYHDPDTPMTIFGCPWCEQWFRLSAEDVAAIQEHMRRTLADDEEAQIIAARLRPAVE